MPRVNSSRAGAAATALFLLALCPATAADLLVDSLRTVGPGSTVYLPIRILTTPDEALASLQFDLVWDRPGLSAVSTAGEAVRGSLKRLYGAANGNRRHLVAALNQEALAADPQANTLVNLFILVDRSAASGTWSLALENTMAVSQSGDPLTLRGGRTTLIVDARLPAEVLPPEAILQAATLNGSAAIAPGTLFRLIGPGTDWNSDLTVLVGGAAAPVVAAGPRWIEFHAPAAMPAGGDATLEVRAGRDVLAAVACQVTSALPGFFTTDATGTGPAVASNGDNEPNSFQRPATPDSTLTLYGTGLGTDAAQLSVWLSARPLAVTSLQPDPAGRPGIQSVTVTLPPDMSADLFTQVSTGPRDGSARSLPGVQVSIAPE